MFNVLYTESARTALDTYFDSFKNYYTSLYSDTGIFSENLIQENYIKVADDLFNIIDTYIEKRLCTDEVFGKRPDPENP